MVDPIFEHNDRSGAPHSPWPDPSYSCCGDDSEAERSLEPCQGSRHCHTPSPGSACFGWTLKPHRDLIRDGGPSWFQTAGIPLLPQWRNTQSRRLFQVLQQEGQQVLQLGVGAAKSQTMAPPPCHIPQYNPWPGPPIQSQNRASSLSAPQVNSTQLGCAMSPSFSSHSHF